jgi:hypothetical protein
VTALWTVTVVEAILTAVASVAVIAVIRQVGLLHLRIEPQREPQPAPGPWPGSQLRLNPARRFLDDGPAPDLVLLGFVRPTCGGCTAALPTFTSVAAGLRGNERALLVSDADEAGTRAYLAAHGVSLPLVVGPHLLRANGIPVIPYAVVADAEGNVLAAGTATSAQQLEAVLSRARATQAVGNSANHDGTERDTPREAAV